MGPKTETQSIEKKVDKPKLIKTLLRTVEVKEGEAVSLTCKFTGEELSVKWSRDNIDIDPNTELTITTIIDGSKGQSTLEYKNTPMSFAGKLLCSISNPVGEVQTTSQITILPGMPTLKGFKISRPIAPSVVKPLLNIESVQENQRIKLQCSFSGSKPLTITWLRDGQVIQKSNVDVMSFNEDEGCATLLWESMPREMEGMFTCRAENKLGLVETHGVVQWKNNFDLEELDHEKKPKTVVEGVDKRMEVTMDKVTDRTSENAIENTSETEKDNQSSTMETSALITQERDTQRMEKMLDKPKLVKTLLRTVEVK